MDSEGGIHSVDEVIYMIHYSHEILHFFHSSFHLVHFSLQMWYHSSNNTLGVINLGVVSNTFTL